MGQISLPIVNRTGIYSHWLSSGDNVYNFSTFFKKSIMLRLLLTSFLKTRLYIYNNLKLKNIINSIKIHKCDYLFSIFKSFIFNKYKLQPLIDSNINFKINNDLLELVNFNKNIFFTKYENTALSITKELPIFPGKIFIAKQQSSLMGVIYLFQPIKGKLPWKRKKVNKKIFNFLIKFNKQIRTNVLFKKESISLQY